MFLEFCRTPCENVVVSPGLTGMKKSDWITTYVSSFLFFFLVACCVTARAGFAAVGS